MIMGVIRGRISDPSIASRIAVYTLAKGLGVSPLEIYQMPISMFRQFLLIHSTIEELKAEELNKKIKG